jgi:hypothetical protein
MKRKESPSLQRGEYVKEIDRYIDEIRSYNATLGHTLATLAFDFDYVQIVSLIQEAKQ